MDASPFLQIIKSVFMEANDKARPSPGYGHHFEHGEGDPSSYRRATKQRLLLSIILTGSMMGVELLGGFLTGSLALISDAGHMLTHFLALLIAFVAIRVATRSAPKRYTFGFYRVEILGGLFNAIFVIFISGIIILEAIQRFLYPVPIAAFELLLISIVGLLVNVATMALLQGSSQDDHNVKGAFLHVFGDTFSSVGVILAAIIILFTGWVFVDPIVSLVIAMVILIWGIQLIRTTTAILLQSAPSQIDMDELTQTICSLFPQIKEIHDIHLWELTSGIFCLSMHLLVTEDCSVAATQELIDNVNHFLGERFGIQHTTLQVECHTIDPANNQSNFIPTADFHKRQHEH